MAIGCYRHGVDPVRMACERAHQSAALRSHTRSVRSGDVETEAILVRSPRFPAHTRSVRTAEAETAKRPSGVMATTNTGLLWPSSVRNVWPLSKSQTRSVESDEADMARRPFGDITTALIGPVWPTKIRADRLLSRSHTRNVPSPEPEIRVGHRALASPYGPRKYGLRTCGSEGRRAERDWVSKVGAKAKPCSQQRLLAKLGCWVPNYQANGPSIVPPIGDDRVPEHVPKAGSPIAPAANRRPPANTHSLR